jgi:hypothetical protein
VSASGDIASFSVDLLGKAENWAEDAWKYLTSYLMSSPPSLGGYDDSARDFMKVVLVSFVKSTSYAEVIVSSWERDARKKGYTMAIDFDGGIQIANITTDIMLGVYVDNQGKWGFFANFGVAATITLDMSASLTMDLYMLFGDKSKYDQSYYFIGMTLDIEGFIVGADAIVTSGFKFEGFQAKMGFGVTYDLFSSGGSSSAKSASSSVDASATLPSLDIYSVDLLSEQGSTTSVASQTASSPSTATSTTTNASAAMTFKSSTILASNQVGGSGGGSFSDDMTNVERIQSITLRGGTYVDAIAITYVLVDGTTVTKSHGGTGGSAVTLTLSSDEYITRVTGRSGSLLDQITFTTSYGRTLSAGGSGGAAFTVDPKANRPIVGVFGRSGSKIDGLGVYYRSGRPFTLQSRNSSLYLDVTGQMSASSGAATIQQRSTGGPNQHWLLVPGSTEGQYCIVSEHTGYYLEALGTSSGASIVLAASNGSTKQLWQLIESSGYWLIKNVGTNLYMDVAGISFEEGAAVYSWTLTSGTNQQWRLAPAATKVTVFSGGGFTDSFQTFGPGRYNMSQITLGNDTIQSIRVPEGWRVTLYHDANFSGSALVLTRDASSLGSMSGQASSLVVEMPPWGATVYTDANYSGSSAVLMSGRYSNMTALGISNDALSSVKVPSGWRVTLYSDSDFGGTTTVLTSSASSLGALGMNDVVSSLVVEEAPLGQVVVYTGTRFTGSMQVFGPGKYDMATLTASGGVGNDKVQSIKVPTSWTVILYGNSGFSGGTKTLTADSSDLGDFNRATSSLVVIPG